MYIVIWNMNIQIYIHEYVYIAMFQIFISVSAKAQKSISNFFKTFRNSIFFPTKSGAQYLCNYFGRQNCDIEWVFQGKRVEIRKKHQWFLSVYYVQYAV